MFLVYYYYFIISSEIQNLTKYSTENYINIVLILMVFHHFI